MPSLSECERESEDDEGNEEEGEAKDRLEGENDCHSVAEENEEEGSNEVTWELTPSDLLSFAWQISSGMVQTQ